MVEQEIHASPTLRPGAPDDARACLDLLWLSVTEFAASRAAPLDGTADDWWSTSEWLYRYLATHHAEWWIAEDSKTGEILGFARSIERGGLFELTEFFVRPGRQSRGLGRALLDRAFPIGRGDIRVIVATSDPRALARYYASDTVAQFSMFTMAASPGAIELDEGQLSPIAITPGSPAIEAVVAIERVVLEFDRGARECEWLAEHREGYLYERGGRPIGFAFVGKHGAGPVASLDSADLPGILLHVESRAHDIGTERLELEVPSINATAVRHLLDRGFRIDPFATHLMASRPFGQFDRFIGFSPPLFL